MKAEDNEFPSILLDDQGSAPATPASGFSRIFSKSDGLYIVDDAGGVTGPMAASGAGAWSSFTPALTGSTTNPTIVNGTILGRYKLIDATTCALHLEYTKGSSDTAGSGFYIIGDLPVTPKTGYFQLLHGVIHDSGSTFFVASLRFAGGAITSEYFVAADAAGDKRVTPTVPMTWATGDKFIFQGTIEID
jgi:hypothetical protein